MLCSAACFLKEGLLNDLLKEESEEEREEKRRKEEERKKETELRSPEEDAKVDKQKKNHIYKTLIMIWFFSSTALIRLPPTMILKFLRRCMHSVRPSRGTRP